MIDLWTFFLTATPLSGLVIYLVHNPEKAEKWGSILSRLFSRLSERAERRSVSGEIQSEINSFAKSIDTKIDPTIFPYGIKIKWEDPTEASYESFVKGENVVIRLKHHSNQAWNFALTTMAYVETGFLPSLRPHFDHSLSEAINLATTQKIIYDRKRSDALVLFNSKILGARPRKKTTLRMYKILTDLTTMGMFDEILLREFADLGMRLSGVLPNEKTRADTRGFVEFFERLTEREPGADVSPTYDRRVLRVSIVFIARYWIYRKMGIKPHLKWIEKCIKDEIDAIYVCARGPNIKAARELDQVLKNNSSLRRVGEDTGKVLDEQGRKVDGICIAYKRLGPGQSEADSSENKDVDRDHVDAPRSAAPAVRLPLP
jgi:hypothetical protein